MSLRALIGRALVRFGEHLAQEPAPAWDDDVAPVEPVVIGDEARAMVDEVRAAPPPREEAPEEPLQGSLAARLRGAR